MGDWHGWRGPEGAVYIAMDPVTGNPALYSMDQVGDTELLAEFTSEKGAKSFQQWADDTIAASGDANRLLLGQLGGSGGYG